MSRIRFNQKEWARWISFAIAIALVFSGGYITGRQTGVESGSLTRSTNTNKAGSADFTELWDAYNILQTKFAGNLNSQDLLYGAINGLVQGAGDPFTVFLKPAQDAAFKSDISGSFEGIGAELTLKDGLITVVAPLDGSPAAKGGLVSGDRIIKIDGKVAPDNLNDAVNAIRGPKGSKVTLTVVHGTDNQTKDVAITRDTIEVKSVAWKKQGDVGVIRISEFTDNTTELTDEAIKDLESQGVRGYVLDLRDDPGGLLQAAIDVASRFMPSGVVVQEKAKDGTTTKDATDHAQVVKDKPVIVLLDAGSASASEILAGALQDAGVAKVVGATSFGKGSVQEIVDLPDKSSIKVTVAHWFTPKGRGIDKVGIKPDVPVELTDADRVAGRDPQMAKALQLAGK